MSLAVVLDAGPLGLLCHRSGVALADECKTWFRTHHSRGTSFYIAEITDYEVRRELLRLNKSLSVLRLDALLTTAADTYLPLTTPAMRKAAALWATARQRGQPTADPKELDADVVLAAQVLTTAFVQTDVFVATGNVGHLSMFLRAADWRTI
jgi:hypothetical protein